MDEVVVESNQSQSITDEIDRTNNDKLPVDEKTKDNDYEQEDEVDDETTMEEEEALPQLEDPLREIRFLEEESNMPINELMVMYGYLNNAPAEKKNKKKKKKKKKTKKNKDNKRKKRLSNSSVGTVSGKRVKTSEEQKLDNSVEGNDNKSSKKDSEKTSKENEDNNKDVCDNTPKLLDLYMAEIEVQSEEEDEDYRPHWEIYRKSVNVGLNFQALVTDGLSTYGDIPYENNDELLWDPNVLGEDLIEDYLMKIYQITKASKQKSKIVGVCDNEKDLYLLVQCGYDVTEALRRISLNVTPQEKSLSVWSEDEKLKFEMGLLVNGKNFHAIQKEVKTRSVAELVHFYYFWKKSDRYDQFERRRVSMHPEIKKWQHWDSEEAQDSDFDNMFQENNPENSEDSLNAAENKTQMKCLIYADRKRQVQKKTTVNDCS